MRRCIEAGFLTQPLSRSGCPAIMDSNPLAVCLLVSALGGPCRLLVWPGVLAVLLSTAV